MGSTTQRPILAIGAAAYAIPDGCRPLRAPQCNEARNRRKAAPGSLNQGNPGPRQGLTGSTQEGLAPMRATTRESGGCFAQLTVPCPCLPTVLGGR